MPYYGNEVIEQVRDANDIVEVISGYVSLKKKGAQYFGLCPFHNEKTPSFSVNREKQIFHCFGCGKGGDVIRFIQEYENLTFVEAMEHLAEKSGITLPKQEVTQEQRQMEDRRSRLLNLNVEAARYFYVKLRRNEGQEALSYFKKRGLSDEIMQQFGLGYADKRSNELYRYFRSKGYTDEQLKNSGLVTIDERRGGRDKFWNRAMFPILDERGRVIAFGGRVLGDGQPKYLNSPETDVFHKSRALYGIHIAKKSKQKQFILCEGYMDVIALHQAGFDNAVASLGTAFTDGHAAVIRRYVTDVYLSYDSDGAGRDAALRALPILKAAGIGCKVIDMSPYKDPDELIKELGADAYSERIAKAQNGFMYRIRMLEEEYDMKDPEGRSRFAEAAAVCLLEFQEEIERNNYIDAIARTYDMTPDGIRSLVVHAAARGIRPVPDASKEKVSGRRRIDIRQTRGDLRSQRLLLRWLSDDPSLYELIAKYITVDDFEDGVYAAVAKEVFRQIKENSAVKPAEILSLFDDEEQIKEVSAIFFEEVNGMEKDDDEGKNRALREVILHLRRDRIKRLTQSLGVMDAAGVQQLMDEKKQLEELEKKNSL